MSSPISYPSAADSRATHPEGSIYWNQLNVYVNRLIEIYGLHKSLQPKMGKSWRARVGNCRYPEVWLRYYAMVRHFHKCTVMASDAANHMSNQHLPLVRDLDLDQQLLWAHARLVSKTKEIQNSNPKATMEYWRQHA